MKMPNEKGVKYSSLPGYKETLGKHLRKLGSIFISLWTPKCRWSANICTLGTVVSRLGFVPACSEQNNRCTPSC
jgi:hypothetical protein